MEKLTEGFTRTIYMKTFFYTVAYSDCEQDCNYKTCPKRYFFNLQNQNTGQKYYPLEGPISYRAKAGKSFPQLGDIVILFVQNSAELERINSFCVSFEGMKKVLVVGDVSGIDGSMYHKLSPRYITQASRAVTELEQVIENMKIPVN